MTAFSPPSTRGWSSKCRQCGKGSPSMQSVAGVQTWQAQHVCDPAHIAALNIEAARMLLEQIAPDPVDVVIARQQEAVIEMAGWVDTRRAVAA